MPRNSSSTSSSERSPGRQAARTVAWMLAGLAALDLSLGWLCSSQGHLPMGERSSLARYFDYGRSLEGKLDQLLVAHEGQVQALADAGWIRPASADQPAAPGPGQDLLVAIYGMSFAHQIGRAMSQQDPRLAMRASGGPGAPLSQCYALFDADRGHHQARVEVLAVLASSLVGTVAMSHMTWNFEVPAACLYPRFELVEGALVRHEPPAADLAQLRRLTADLAGRRRLRDALQEHDAFFEPLVFDAVLDDSVLVRMMRRSYGQSREAAITARMHDAHGFHEAHGMPELARALASRFIAQVLEAGALPVLLLIDDRGHADHLERVFAPVSSRPEVLCFSTHEVAEPADAANFVADGHFTPTVNQRIAAALRERLNARLGRR